jgi:phage terminase small subunit
MGTKWRFFVQNTLKTTSTTEAARDAGFDPDSDEFNNGLLRVREILREYVPEEML